MRCGQVGNQGCHRLKLGIDSEGDRSKASIGNMKERLSVNVALVTDRDNWRLNYMARLLMERGEAY